ncbi:VOC family protein [Candidatus Gracilibacteria bacterium]|nr:VOC family protein [Candidatus Gracilibacteria bacterium]
MIVMIDHVVVLVDDVGRAASAYRALGFTVLIGGEHADGSTHNALVSFADGSYLELLAFQREAAEHRWWHHRTAGEGLIDFALLPSDTDADVAAARARGLALNGPFDGGRLRPDGARLQWKTALATTEDLPFLCGDVTPRVLRVAGGAATTHQNGVRGIREVVVAVADVAASSERYTQLLGTAAEADGSFALGSGRIRLFGPAHNAAAERLARRGEGVLALAFDAPDGAIFPAAQSHGAELR